jgi:hypothetical protein
MKKVNADFVRHVGGLVMAMQVTKLSDPTQVSDDYLAKMADVSMRAAMALDGAIERADGHHEAKSAEAHEGPAKKS